MSYQLAQAAAHSPAKKTAQLVLIHLADVANDRHVREHDGCLIGECYPSQDYLSYVTGYGLSAIRDATKELEKLGLLKIKSRGRQGKSTEYILRIPTSAPKKKNQAPENQALDNQALEKVTLENQALTENSILSENTTLSEKEEIKENTQSINVIKQNNNIESNIEAPEKVLSDDVERKNDFDFDSQEVFKKFRHEIAADLSKMGMGNREITLRLAYTHSSYLEEAAKHKAAGWKHVKTTPEQWCKGVWRNMAAHYNGYELTKEDLLYIVREHYYKKYPQRLSEVNEVLADHDSKARLVLEATAGGWKYIGVKEVIPYVIQMFAKPMAEVCS